MSASYPFAPISWQNVTLRLGIALLTGAIVGLERELKDKPAGLRTNMLVSFGSALIVLVPIQIGAAEQNLGILKSHLQSHAYTSVKRKCRDAIASPLGRVTVGQGYATVY